LAGPEDRRHRPGWDNGDIVTACSRDAPSRFTRRPHRGGRTGGSGGVAGTIVGAFALRLIPSILFFARVNPLQQPLWEGTVILLAVAAGASRIFTVRNRLDTMR